VPPLRSFRFPAKFLYSPRLAALAANATDVLQRRGLAPGSSILPLRAVKANFGVWVTVALATVISLVLVAPFTGARAFYDLAWVGVADPVAGAGVFIPRCSPSRRAS
jgi:hypothetical protein